MSFESDSTATEPLPPLLLRRLVRSTRHALETVAIDGPMLRCSAIDHTGMMVDRCSALDALEIIMTAAQRVPDGLIWVVAGTVRDYERLLEAAEPHTIKNLVSSSDRLY